MKRCNKCGETKALSFFPKDRTKRDGHHSVCKECKRPGMSAWMRANKEHRVEYMRAYMQDPDNRKKRQLRVASFRENNREKHLAHVAVRWAVRSGKITKSNCEVCGSDLVVAHHDDYSKPLDVRWLCAQHHRDVHNKPVLTKVGA